MKGEDKRSELEALFVDRQEGNMDRALREALEGRVAIEKSSGRLLSKPGLFKLGQGQRLLVLLLARHALARLGLGEGDLELPTEELAQGESWRRSAESVTDAMDLVLPKPVTSFSRPHFECLSGVGKERLRFGESERRQALHRYNLLENERRGRSVRRKGTLNLSHD